MSEVLQTGKPDQTTHRPVVNSEDPAVTRIWSLESFASEELRGAPPARITQETLLMLHSELPLVEAHSRRMAVLARDLAAERGFSQTQLEMFMQALLLHDVGKTAIPRAVLEKPGALTPEERQQIQAHAQKGLEIEEQIEAKTGSQLSPLTKIITAGHHISNDGRGYPAEGVVLGVVDGQEYRYTGADLSMYPDDVSVQMDWQGQPVSFTIRELADLVKCSTIGDVIDALTEPYRSYKEPIVQPPFMGIITGVDLFQRAKENMKDGEFRGLFDPQMEETFVRLMQRPPYTDWSQEQDGLKATEVLDVRFRDLLIVAEDRIVSDPHSLAKELHLPLHYTPLTDIIDPSAYITAIAA
ncbi:MAG: HD-GYP domain-containing protein [Patescibacteria group bacterium]